MDKHKQYDKYKRNQEAKSFYRSKSWLMCRHHILVRDNYLCQWCLKDRRIVPADVVHHIKELEDYPELALTASNLESLCHACHTRHHKKENPNQKELENTKAEVVMKANKELG